MAKVSYVTKLHRKNARQIRFSYKIACWVSFLGMTLTAILLWYPQLFQQCATYINRIVDFFT